jgi:LysM repeat protein
MALAVVLAGVSSACGTTDPASQERLPPIRTTVASTTTTSTTIPPGQRFYTIKLGDTLAAIAASFEVTVESIVALNDLDDPNDIQADQTIEIPSNVVVVTELPDPEAVTTTP